MIRAPHYVSLDELERTAFDNPGSEITRTTAGWQLKTRIDGTAVTLYAADEAEVRHG